MQYDQKLVEDDSNSIEEPNVEEKGKVCDTPGDMRYTCGQIIEMKNALNQAYKQRTRLQSQASTLTTMAHSHSRSTVNVRDTFLTSVSRQPLKLVFDSTQPYE